MDKKKKIILIVCIAAVVALCVWYFGFRDKKSAAVGSEGESEGNTGSSSGGGGFAVDNSGRLDSYEQPESVFDSSNAADQNYATAVMNKPGRVEAMPTIVNTGKTPRGYSDSIVNYGKRPR